MSRIPLWRRKIPRPPLFWQGNPQLRILLPQFWMKMVKPKRAEIPKNQVHFIVHPQMSKPDIKQYLEKIYRVPVQSVRTVVLQGKNVNHPANPKTVRWREDDAKMAFVTLADGETFEFPEIFKDGKPSEKQQKEMDEMKDKQKATAKKDWDKLALPPWFR